MQPKTVLFLSSNQPGRAWLDIDREVRRVSQAIEEGPHGTQLRFHNRPAVQVTDVASALVADRPVVVHFSGHGQPGGRLVLFDQDDKPKDVDPIAFASVIARGGVELVVLNACFSEPLAKALVDAGVRFVVGAEGKVPDEAALAFSEVLYRVLAHGSSLRAAFDQAVATAALQLTGDHRFRLVTQPAAVADGWKLVEPPPPRDDRPPLQVALILDVYEGRTPPELPDRRKDRVELKLSAGAVCFPRLKSGDDPRAIDWRALGNAVEDLGARLRQVLADHPQDPVDYYVYGNAPLPVYAHLGFVLSAWTERITVFNWDKPAETHRELPLGATPRSTPLFEREGLEHASSATGRVAVYVSCGRAPDPQIDAKIVAHLRERGEPLAGIVKLTTTDHLDAHNIGSCARELMDALSHQLPSVYAQARGVELFVAGPATLALCAGRAINPNQLDLAVPNYANTEYVPAIGLPWRRGAPRAPSMAAEDLLERRS